MDSLKVSSRRVNKNFDLVWSPTIRKKVEDYVHDKYKSEYKRTAIQNYRPKTKTNAGIFLAIHYSHVGLTFTEEELKEIRAVAGVQE